MNALSTLGGLAGGFSYEVTPRSPSSPPLSGSGGVRIQQSRSSCWSSSRWPGLGVPEIADLELHPDDVVVVGAFDDIPEHRFRVHTTAVMAAVADDLVAAC